MSSSKRVSASNREYHPRGAANVVVESNINSLLHDSHPIRETRSSSKKASENVKPSSAVSSTERKVSENVTNQSSAVAAKRKRDVLKSDVCNDVKVYPEAATLKKCDCDAISLNTSDESDDLKTCSICLEVPEESEFAKLDGCTHLFCFSCIEKWSQRENTCPLCKVRFNKIERLLKTNAKGGKKKKGQSNDGANSKKIKNRDQSADMYSHSSIQGFLGTFITLSETFLFFVHSSHSQLLQKAFMLVALYLLTLLKSFSLDFSKGMDPTHLPLQGQLIGMLAILQQHRTMLLQLLYLSDRLMFREELRHHCLYHPYLCLTPMRMMMMTTMA